MNLSLKECVTVFCYHPGLRSGTDLSLPVCGLLWAHRDDQCAADSRKPPTVPFIHAQSPGGTRSLPAFFSKFLNKKSNKF